MLTATKLFFIRLKQHYRYIGKSLSIIADWTVWLYILIPGLVIFAGLYHELWTSLPIWSHSLRWDLIIIAVNSFMLISTVHIGVDEADRLILLQHQGWLITLKRYGYVYSAIMLVIRLLLLLVLLLPFIKGTTELTSGQLQQILTYTITVGLSMLTINHYFTKASIWWKRLLRSSLRSLLLGVVYTLPAALYVLQLMPLAYLQAAMLIATILLIIRYMTTSFHYGHQLEQEQTKRAGFTGLLLSQVEEKQSTKRLKKPWIFRSSQRLFKAPDMRVVLTELRIKAMLRSWKLLQVWIIIIATGSYAIFLVGGSGVWAVIIGLVLLKRSAFSLQWDQWIKSDYISLYVKEQYAAYKLSQNLLTVPGLIIWIVIAILCSL